MGEVTCINSSDNVSVDGMPRHVLDVRRVLSEDDENFEDCRESAPGSSEEEIATPVHQESPSLRMSNRVRHPPSYLVDYDTST